MSATVTDIILDCDPGHDDAIALLLALASPELRLLGVTTVAGNQTLEKTTANAIRVLDQSTAPTFPSLPAPTGRWSASATSPPRYTARPASTAPTCRRRRARPSRRTRSTGSR